MKIGIIFHSSCGNTYLVAREYKKALEEMNLDADIFKVDDNINSSLSNYLINAREYKEHFESIKIVKSGEELLDYDVIFMGSPTYYGNVSGQMKMFIDTFSNIWVKAPFKGKLFGSFATAGSNHGGGELALQAMNIFAQHMGMSVLSVACTVSGNNPAYGMLHIAGPNADIKLSDTFKIAIREYIKDINIL